MTKRSDMYKTGIHVRVFQPIQSTTDNDPEEFMVDFLSGVLSRAPEHEAALDHLAATHAKRGEHEACLRICTKLARIRPFDPWVHFILGCTYSRLRRKEESLQALDRAVQLGIQAYGDLLNDPALDFVRTDAHFHALVTWLRNEKRAA